MAIAKRSSSLMVPTHASSTLVASGARLASQPEPIMICRTCNGAGVVDRELRMRPWPDCHAGQQHCCDGERVQPVEFGVGVGQALSPEVGYDLSELAAAPQRRLTVTKPGQALGGDLSPVRVENATPFSADLPKPEFRYGTAEGRFIDPRRKRDRIGQAKKAHHFAPISWRKLSCPFTNRWTGARMLGQKESWPRFSDSIASPSSGRSRGSDAATTV